MGTDLTSSKFPFFKADLCLLLLMAMAVPGCLCSPHGKVIPITFCSSEIIEFKEKRLSQPEFLSRLEVMKFHPSERVVFICEETTPYLELKRIRDKLSSRGISRYALSDGKAVYPVMFGCFNEMPPSDMRSQSRFIICFYKDHVVMSRTAIPLTELNLESDPFPQSYRYQWNLAGIAFPHIDADIVHILERSGNRNKDVGVEFIINDINITCDRLLKVLSVVCGKGIKNVCVVSR